MGMGERGGSADQGELLRRVFAPDIHQQRQDAHQGTIAVAPFIRVVGKVFQFGKSAATQYRPHPGKAFSGLSAHVKSMIPGRQIATIQPGDELLRLVFQVEALQQAFRQAEGEGRVIRPHACDFVPPGANLTMFIHVFAHIDHGTLLAL